MPQSLRRSKEIEVSIVGTTKLFSKLPCNQDFFMGRQTMDHLLKALHSSGEAVNLT